MNNDLPEPDSNDDWRDRLVHRALGEVVGGESPPDLTERILAVHAASAGELSPTSSSGAATMLAETPSRRLGFRTWALAASLLLNLGLGAWLLASRQEGRWVALLVDNSGSHKQQAHEREQIAEEADLQVLRDTISLRRDSSGQRPATSDGSQATDPSSRKIRIPLPSSEPLERFVNDAHSSSEGQQGHAQGVVAPVPPPTSLATLSANEPLSPHESLAPSDEFGGDTVLQGSMRFSRQGQGSRFDGGGLGGGGENLYADGLGGAGQGQSVDGLDRGTAFPGFTADLDLPERAPSYDKLYWSSYGTRVKAAEPFQGDPEGLGLGPGAAGDQYSRIVENPFKLALGEQAISTFSIDVDTASYANVRQMLENNVYPPADSVRLEEFVNYFTYEGKYDDFVGDFPGGTSEEKPPFAAQVEVTGCPWEPKHRLVKVGVFGREVEATERPKSNLVFLVDVSGSMNSPEKLPLVVHGMQQLASELGENDKVAIVVYASSEGLVLPSTSGDQQDKILGALGNLTAGGSTAGGAGITLAYQVALENFIEGGTNRVILCTDGDFNVGTTSTAELERMVEQKAKDTKVFLSVIGFGRGNLNDSMMEKITGIGNGNYYYVDSQREAERVFVKGMTGMLVTIAKDVKIQIEFNPNKVAGYRLLGYENRMLRTEDFNDDTKDAGEIGAGHRVTALYEIVPAGEPVQVAETDDFKYQRPPGMTPEAETDEMLTLKMRYKEPESDTSKKLEWTATDPGKEYGQATADTRFAAAVAGFGMLLRDSEYKGNATFDAVHELATAAMGSDPDGERSEFLTLVEAAKRLKGEIDAAKKAEEEAAKAAAQAPAAEPTPSTEPRAQDATPVAPK